MDKFEMVIGLVVALVISFFIASVTYYNILELSNEVVMANTGLEECLANPGESISTIWVKDCEKYLIQLQKLDR